MLTSELAFVWIASDGRKFLSEKEARVYEDEYNWKEQQRQEFKEITQSIKEKKEKIRWMERQLKRNLQ